MYIRYKDNIILKLNNTYEYMLKNKKLLNRIVN